MEEKSTIGCTQVIPYIPKHRSITYSRGDIQGTLSKEGYNQSFFDISGSLKKDDQGIDDSHEGHGDDHTPKKGDRVRQGRMIANEKAGKAQCSDLIGDQTKQGESGGNSTTEQEKRALPSSVVCGVDICEYGQ